MTSPKKKPALKSLADITKEDVLRIWTLRAGRNRNQDIAKSVGCAPWICSQVIAQGVGPKVPIPAAIRSAALETVHRKHRTNGSKQHQLPPGMGFTGLTLTLAEFINACLNFERCRKACIADDIGEDALDNLFGVLKAQAAKDAAKA